MNTNQPSNRIPLWVLIVSGLLALVGISVGISLYAMPPSTFIPGLDDNAAVRYLSQMCGARQLSIALILAFSVIRRSAHVLRVALAFYVLMNIQDAIIGVVQHDTGMITGAIVVMLLTGSMFLAVHKRMGQ